MKDLSRSKKSVTATSNDSPDLPVSYLGGNGPELCDVDVAAKSAVLLLRQSKRLLISGFSLTTGAPSSSSFRPSKYIQNSITLKSSVHSHSYK